MSGHHRIRLERVRAADSEQTLRLLVRSLRGVGWRAVCSCGWQGERRRGRRLALADLREHAEAT